MGVKSEKAFKRVDKLLKKQGMQIKKIQKQLKKKPGKKRKRS